MKTARSKGWEKMETLLDREMPVRTSSILIQIGYAASILIVLGIATALLQKSVQPPVFDSISVKNIDDSMLYPYYDLTFLEFRKQKLKDEFVLKLNESRSTSSETLIASNTIQTIEPLMPQNNSIRINISAQDQFVVNDNTTQNPLETVIQHKRSTNTTHTAVDKSSKVSQNNISFQSESEFNSMMSNQDAKSFEVISPFELKTAFQPKIDLGFQTNGSVGFVSKNFEDYGMRVGLEVKKPLGKKVALNSGIRYSRYNDTYSSTYFVDGIENEDHTLISRMQNRDVQRRFIELPIYADYKLTDVIKIKAGTSLTYNKNESEASPVSTQQLRNSNMADDLRTDAGKLLSDQAGYLGEAVVGLSVDVDKISLEIEGNYGLISNQKIDNRSILGARISYKFGE